jgi:hypothetical protein
MNNNDSSRQRAIIVFLVALSLLSYARLYMLRDGYADDNCWLLAMHISDGLGAFLDTGFFELRRVPQGIFVYLHLLPYRFLQDPYVVWHTIDLAVQVAMPIVLYRFARQLCEDSRLAVFIAAAWIVVPIDHVVPYLCSLNYRLGTLLGLISLSLTDSAAREGKGGWKIVAALVLAAFASHVLTEAAIGLEPARAVLLWLRFYRAERPFARTVGSVTKWLIPFALVAGALVFYKLAFKPYGIYAGSYSTGWSHFFDRETVNGTIRLFLIGVWRLLRPQAGYAQTATLVMAVIAGALAFYALQRRRPQGAPSGVSGPIFQRWPHLSMIALGLLLVAPALFIFLYAGRPPRLGPDANHGTIMQPGYAMVVGAAVHWAFVRLSSTRRPLFVPAAGVLALLVGTGVYFNNLNLDLFNVASAKQQQFWQAFKERFPTPPQGTTFFIDALAPVYNRRMHSFYQFEDLHSSYALELGLNRLYEPGRLKGERRYKVYPFEEMRDDYRHKGPALFRAKLTRTGHYATETLDFTEMTFVYWRGGKALVNHEIVKVNRAAVYGEPADKPLPSWAKP